MGYLGRNNLINLKVIPKMKKMITLIFASALFMNLSANARVVPDANSSSLQVPSQLLSVAKSTVLEIDIKEPLSKLANSILENQNEDVSRLMESFLASIRHSHWVQLPDWNQR